MHRDADGSNDRGRDRDRFLIERFNAAGEDWLDVARDVQTRLAEIRNTGEPVPEPLAEAERVIKAELAAISHGR